MTRDTVKTVVGLIIIAGIVVATFVYGNAQRKSQLKHDAAVKQQQTQVATNATPATTATPVQTATPKATTNTAPVQSPQANAIQGGSAAASSAPKPTVAATPKPTATPSPKATPKASGAVVAASTTPQTGGTNAPLPQTGGTPLEGAIGVAAIGAMWVAMKRSRRAIEAAARR